MPKVTAPPIEMHVDAIHKHFGVEGAIPRWVKPVGQSKLTRPSVKPPKQPFWRWLIDFYRS